jgi:uncharacterized protein YwgA
MNPQVTIGLIKRDKENFNMFSFDNRLRLQKFVYILQHMFEVNMDYDFNWYHYGPYSKQLAQDGFNVNCDEVQKIKFEDETTESNFGQFLSFINKKDNFWMEVVASIHFLKKLRYSDAEIISTIKQKHTEFNNKGQEIQQIFTELVTLGRI